MRYYLTTAIDYVNSQPHLGTAYEKITADVIARYRRARGEDVLFLMGNDEHSQKVAQAARDQDLDPLDFCDRMEKTFRAVWSALDVVPDDFIRTTQERHKVAVREVVRRIHERGDLYQGEYEGWYCVGCEAFKRPEDLVEGKCPDHVTQDPEWVKERNWFFRLTRYAPALRQHFADHPEFVRPAHRRNELLALLERGLEDVSVSRSSLHWGVTFPFDSAQVVYVWFDALINYIAGTGWPADGEKFGKWWPADLHLVGKDITRFHAIIWPAMLLGAGLELPRCVFGHGFVNLAGGRMSKSAGRMADPMALSIEYGSDALRYFLCAEASFGNDLDWSEDRLRTRINSELANGLGNLCSRTISMLVRYRDGVVGPPPAGSELLAEAGQAARDYCEAMDELDLRSGLNAAMGIVERANQHVDRTQPFTLAKDPTRRGELQRVLAELANSLLIATRLFFPFMPRKMAALHLQLACVELDPTKALIEAETAVLHADRVLQKGEPLFPRLEEPRA